MAKTRVLITVKTYPTPSSSYDELVCTAGFTEDGKWIRIYPIPFRKLNYVSRYSKYDIVEIDLVKNTSDFRPESYRPRSLDVEDPIKVVGHLDTKSNWAKRKSIVLSHFHNDMTLLIKEAKDNKKGTSLAVFKPTKIHDFIIKPEKERDWSQERLEQMKQVNLFEEQFKVVRKLPFKFSFVFEDLHRKQRTLMVEDWEVGALFWKMLKQYGDEKKACEAVRAKYYDDFAKTKDLYFFLGTTKLNHYRAPNPFIIIGTFQPKKESQIKLDI
jgi:hypothetical protein